MVEKLIITLPTGMIDAIHARVRAGIYASASDVVRAAMQALLEQDEDFAARIASIEACVRPLPENRRAALTIAEVKTWIDDLADGPA